MSQETLYGFAATGIVPLRKDASDSSEMLTQVLLGETVKISELTERWARVTCDYDGYEGWTNRQELEIFGGDTYHSWKQNSAKIRSPHFSFRMFRQPDDVVLVPPGASIVVEDDRIQLPNGIYHTKVNPVTLIEDEFLKTAKNFLGTPYLWGGRTDQGIDCSGFVQLVLSLHGMDIPRDSGKQHAFRKEKSKDIHDAEPGDLIYFNPSGDHISHVGFYLGDGDLLHASGKVKINHIVSDMENPGNYPENKRLENSVFAVQTMFG